MNKDNSSAVIGGLASVMNSANDTTTSTNERNNAPLMTVMRQDSSASMNQLHIESTTGLLDELEDSEDESPRTGEKRAGRRKIKIEYIDDKSRRHITFSKRKAGIMKKAYELSTLTGTQVLLLVASETGHVYTFATPKLQPLITKQEGKNLIQACLNSPDVPAGIPEYPISSSASASGTQSVPSTYTSTAETDAHEEESSRSASASFSALTGLSGYAPYSGMVGSGSMTPTPSTGSNVNSASAASAAAAAAAQVFMNPQVNQMATAYSYPSGQAANSAYWSGNANMYASAGKSSVQTQQQQQQQQQMYHQALLQQQHQQQLLQQYHHQQQHHHTQQSQSSQSTKAGILDLSDNIVDHE